MLKTPVLFLIFNRPDLTEIVFNEIKKAKPEKLYIAADGHKENVPGDKEKCEKTRKITEKIDWDCEVKTLFREKNLGLKTAVSSAIDWFFENEEEGIILEDDCVPAESFFCFCGQLLEYYRDEPMVMHIAGESPLDESFGNASYYFSSIEHCWGWATWKRAWKHFDITMSDYPQFRESNQIARTFGKKYIQKKWLDIFDRLYAGQINSWAYIWTYTVFKNNGLCVNPNANMIKNIGHGIDGTHTKFSHDWPANRKICETGKIIHPESLTINKKAVGKILEKRFKMIEPGKEKRQKLIKKLLFKLKRLLRKTMPERKLTII